VTPGRDGGSAARSFVSLGFFRTAQEGLFIGLFLCYIFHIVEVAARLSRAAVNFFDQATRCGPKSCYTTTRSRERACAVFPGWLSCDPPPIRAGAARVEGASLRGR